MNAPYRPLFHFLVVLCLLLGLSACIVPNTPQQGLLTETSSISDLPLPDTEFFSALPYHLMGETVSDSGYTITLSNPVINSISLQVSAVLINHSERAIDLHSALTLYDPEGARITPQELAGELLPGKSISLIYTFPLPAPISEEDLLDYRILYTPFGWSGPVIAYLLAEQLPDYPTPTTPPPGESSMQGGTPTVYNGVTGDPWKMLILIYPNIDTDYVEGGVTKHLTATMPTADQTAMRNDYMNNQPHRNHVYDYSDHTAEVEAKVIVVDRALTGLPESGYGVWPAPSTTHTELDLYAPDGLYDSVIIFWQPSNPTTGQSLPLSAWGLGRGPGNDTNNMTYATVFNLGWYWPSDPCHGEVFLHEWLHGVTYFYKYHLGFEFNISDLHGAEEAGYSWDYSDGCWDNWLRDYMRGLVYENGQRKALVPATWQSGSITTHHINNWRGEYFNNTNLSDIPIVVRNDPSLNFEWQGNPPHPLLLSDGISARWTDDVTFTADVWKFNVMHDDGARLYVDNVLVFENWCSNCWVTDHVNVTLSAGSHHIVLEMWENQGWSAASLSWEPAVLPPRAFIPIIRR